MSATAETLSGQTPPPMGPSPEEDKDALVNLLNSIVPPDTIAIRDVFNNTHEFPSTVSARSQIRVLREFDKIKSLDIGDLSQFDMSNIVSLIIQLATKEEVLKSISRCFYFAHPRILEKAKETADNEGYDYEDGDFCAADLFPLEEMVAAIVPLFLRLAKKGGTALASLS